MQFWVGVENFARIESAKICVDQYTLLVGPNNSGKTFLMQLVQGLTNKLTNLIEDDITEVVLEKQIDGYRRYVISEKNILRFVEYINSKLHLKKEKLVREIFGRDISIEKLYVDIKLEPNTAYQIDITDKESLENDEVKRLINLKVLPPNFFSSNIYDNRQISVLSCINTLSNTSSLITVGIYLQQLNVLGNVMRTLLEQNSLFLPASRTGLMLLYRDFFANKADNAISYQIEGNELIEDGERYGGLTQPIYEFLRFLQTYSGINEQMKRYINELNFFERHVIDGHIEAGKQGYFSYKADCDNHAVPMHLASAMVNEVTPLILALSSRVNYKRLIIDEVEASLHPQKQLELARFLNRIHNKGMKLIFSTHSDTFVSKLNNLYILSEYVKRTGKEDIIERFHLEKEDLVQSDNLFVYEFMIQPNGKSIVSEIVPDAKTGYQFDLFTKQAMNLYDEAVKLGEMHE